VPFLFLLLNTIYLYNMRDVISPLYSKPYLDENIRTQRKSNPNQWCIFAKLVLNVRQCHSQVIRIAATVHLGSFYVWIGTSSRIHDDSTIIKRGKCDLFAYSVTIWYHCWFYSSLPLLIKSEYRIHDFRPLTHVKQPMLVSLCCCYQRASKDTNLMQGNHHQAYLLTLFIFSYY
jgi:hypothetical protein